MRWKEGKWWLQKALLTGSEEFVYFEFRLRQKLEFNQNKTSSVCHTVGLCCLGFSVLGQLLSPCGCGPLGVISFLTSLPAPLPMAGIWVTYVKLVK